MKLFQFEGSRTIAGFYESRIIVIVEDRTDALEKASQVFEEFVDETIREYGFFRDANSYEDEFQVRRQEILAEFAAEAAEKLREVVGDGIVIQKT